MGMGGAYGDEDDEVNSDAMSSDSDEKPVVAKKGKEAPKQAIAMKEAPAPKEAKKTPMDLEKSLKLANKNGQENQEMSGALEGSSDDMDDYDEEGEDDFGIDMEEGEYDMEDDDDSQDEELMKKIEAHGKKQG